MNLDSTVILMIGIIFFVSVFGLYIKFKKEGLDDSPKMDAKTRRHELGFTILMIGLICTVTAYGFSFILSTTTDMCIVNETKILINTMNTNATNDSLDTSKIDNCVNKNDLNIDTYYIGFAGILLLAFATFLLSPLPFRRSRT